MSSIFRLVAAGYIFFLIAPASGAEIRHTNREEMLATNFANVILEGKIEAGDYDKLLKLVDEDCRDYNCIAAIYLASPGGDLVEAMKIGHLIRKLRLETRVPSDVTPIPSYLLPQYGERAETLLKKAEASIKGYKAILKDAKANYMCASACFFIFVAGIEREGNTWPPVLGIHRPYLSDADLKRISGNQAIASAGQMRTVVEDYLKEMGVPAKYAELMFSVPKDQVRFIDEDEFESDFLGYIPELQDWLDAKCNNLTDVEKVLEQNILGKARRKEKLTEDEERMDRMLHEKFLKKGDCLAEVLPKLREDAWKEFHRQ